MLRTVKYTIRSSKLTAPVTVVHLSDLHGFSQAPSADAILRAVRALNPDVIAMTGDMVDSRTKSFEPFLKLCRALSRICLCYYIPGNHEQALKASVLQQLMEDINTQGVSVLENSHQYLAVRGQSLAVYGLTTPLSTYRERITEHILRLGVDASGIERALGPCPRHPMTLLLYHNPLRFPACARWGADVTLAGHIHGGIVRLPVLGGLLSPDATLFPVYDGGHYEMDGRRMVVSRGLGNTFARRIGNPPEIACVTLAPL